ncbi:MAG: hypothetical protein ACREJB_07605 [Planctomycetaceae bacterium]
MLIWAVELRTMAKEDAATLLRAIEAGQFSRCLLPWIPLLDGGSDGQLIEDWKQAAAAEPDAHRRSDYGALALIFAELAGRGDAWKPALKGWNMKQSQQVLEWQEEARKEGREEALRHNLVRALEVRFEGVPEELRSRITAQTDWATLNQWFDLALTAEDLESFQRGI